MVRRLECKTELMTMIDSRLKEWATPREIQILEAIESEGSERKAAKALGLGHGSISNAVGRLRKRAARQGYAPGHWTGGVAPGYVTGKVTVAVNAKTGEVERYWQRQHPDAAKTEETLREFAAMLAEGVKGLAPVAKAPKRSDEDLMCIYPMGDPHFGMHAWWADAGNDFDLKEAEHLTCAAVDRLVASAPAARTALLLNLGDMFHADNQKNQSQSGHQLDVDGRWAKVQQVGLRAMLHCIQRLLEKHEHVIVRINRGNHDGHSAYALSLMLSCFFHDEPRVAVDLSPAFFWYHQFGRNLIGSTHGDTAKGPDMPSIMASDMPEAWGATSHRYWYVGHVHHSDLKEYRGCTVEYFRTLAARDAWHAGQGYRAGRDMRLIVLHKIHGEIERHRCDVAMLNTA